MKYILHVSPTHLSLCLVMIGLPSTFDNNLYFFKLESPSIFLYPWYSPNFLFEFYLILQKHSLPLLKKFPQPLNDCSKKPTSKFIFNHSSWFFFSFLAKLFYLFAKILLLSKNFIYFWLNLYPSTKHMYFHGKLLYFLC